jgi:hypothetical protein
LLPSGAAEQSVSQTADTTFPLCDSSSEAELCKSAWHPAQVPLQQVTTYQLQQRAIDFRNSSTFITADNYLCLIPTALFATVW